MNLLEKLFSSSAAETKAPENETVSVKDRVAPLISERAFITREQFEDLPLEEVDELASRSREYDQWKAERAFTK